MTLPSCTSSEPDFYHTLFHAFIVFFIAACFMSLLVMVVIAVGQHSAPKPPRKPRR